MFESLSSKFNVKCKGQLVGKQGQHWFLGLWARSGIQARSTLVPRLVKRAPRCCSGQSPLAVLGGGVKTWRGVKTRSLEELKWHFGRKLRDLNSPDDPMWRGCTTSVDPVNAQRRVTFSRREDSGSTG